MLTARTKLTLGAAALTLGLSGYYLYDAFSTQGQGELAQAPMNIESQIPPAFIMALDDSGSMVWEVLNNTRDGVFAWNDNERSFYRKTGAKTPYGYNEGSQNFYFQFVYPGRGDTNAGIPPLDAFGFARSPQLNPAYFDPTQEYPTWKKSDGTDYMTVNATAAPVDPRPAGSTNRSGAVVDLTTVLDETDNAWGFRFRSGMVLPVGTAIYGNACGGSLQAGRWNTLTSAMTIGRACTAPMKYLPATFYLTDPSRLPPAYGYTATPAAITSPPGGAPTTLYKYEILRANFVDDAHYTKAINNFANWFTFYRTRREALIGSLTNALVGVNQQMRIGWFTINAPKSDVTMYNITSDPERQSLFARMYSISASGSTPTRQAVQWLGKQFQRNEGPAGSLPIQYSCQKNAGMLFTDGYINETATPGGYGNADNAMGVPFRDAYSDTMADIAASFYKTNLRPDLDAGDVPVPDSCQALYDPSTDAAGQSLEWKRLDCNTNPHMNFYGITLGTQGEIYGVNAAATADPYANPPAWAARTDNSPRAVDEMWHATLNARGELVNAKSPGAIADAMRQIIASVGAGSTPSGTLSLTGSRIGTGSLTVTPFYESRNNGTDWYSTLTAQRVRRDNTTGLISYEDAWEASAKLPAAADRNIYYGTSTGASLFNAGNLTLAALCNSGGTMSRCADTTKITNATTDGGLGISLTEAVAYLRGDQSLETSTTKPLRSRTTRLGDIVNSTPIISAAADDYGYRSLYDSTSNRFDVAGYAAYLSAKKTANRQTVYVGANDGMLHAFDGATGVERFAYVPQSVLGHMGNLLFPYKAADKDNQNFQHRYYVDGPVVVSDYSKGGTTWGTALVATTGAGGKGVFALDVTNPAAFTNTNKLWEINDKSADAAISNNIGHVLGKPVLVPVRSTGGSISWKAIFGNGYNSTNGQAVLFVVDIGSGKVTLIPAGEAGVAGSNGLGNIVVLDRWSGTNLTTATRDGYADTVYAADQQGAVWKFDLRSVTANPATTTTLTKVVTPLFVAKDAAGNRQPILGGLQAAAGPGGGVMLYFGTGGFSFKSDATDTSQQTFYGVLDRGGTVTLGRADLLQQLIVTTTADGSRTTTANAMPYGKSGWYLDLTANGERFVGYPQIENGIVFFPTFDPKSTTGTCVTGGTNWLYGLNALTGAAALSGVRVGSPMGSAYATGTGAVSLSTKGSAPVKDVAVMTAPRLAPLSAGATPEQIEEALAAQCSMIIQVAGAQPLYMPRACGRQSWRQIK